VIESSIPIYLNLISNNFRMYESSRITVQPLILLAVFLACHSIGCNGEDHSSVPVPISVSPPYSYSGHIERVWGGDNFEVVDNGQLHYAFIRGIDTPEAGQAYYDESKVMLRRLSGKNKTTINVFDRDEWKREVCEVEITDSETGELVDPAYELLRNGFAWFDQSDGLYAEKYRAAETLARSQKIGIWSQANPVPPWEFWEQQQQLQLQK